MVNYIYYQSGNFEILVTKENFKYIIEIRKLQNF